jgi:hypothetical protein
MAHQAGAPTDESVKSFEKGIDRDSPRTKIKPGGYEDAQNMLLLSGVSGQHPTSMQLDSVLDPLMVWPTGNPQWCAPFSYSTYTAATQVLAFTTELIVARAGGQYHRYLAGAPGTVTNVRRLVNTTGTGANVWQINSFVYDKWLCTVDGRNAPMKYGQHFLADRAETLPYMFPIGSLPLTACGPSLAGETWTFPIGATPGSLVLDASVPGGGSRVGAASVFLPANAGTGTTALCTFSGGKDFTKAPTPYGGRAFVSTDSAVFSYMGTTTASANAAIRYETDAANYFQVSISAALTANTWVLAGSILLSALTVVGAPSWANISGIRFINNHATQGMYMDDIYLLYSDAPPSAAVGTSHKDRIVLGGAPLIGAVPSLGTIVYSNAQNPDNYAAGATNNTQIISGGFESLAKTNQITALREFQDSVIVGTPSAIFAWTVNAPALPTTASSPAKSTISTEHGIDSQRGVIETPNGSLIFPWQRGFYILRATGRQFIGAKIQPFLTTMALDDPSWTMTVLDETTKTIRVWWRTGANATATSAGIVFDYVLAQETGQAVWPSTMTQMADWAVPVYISGVRSIVYTRSGSPQIFVLNGNTTTGGALTSYITLPWLSRLDDTHVTKWLAATVAYASKVPVDVQIRYANNPGEFDSAVFTTRRTLPANPTITESARIGFGGTTRWAQIKLQATTLDSTAGQGFEIFPPVHLVPVDTQRIPD